MSKSKFYTALKVFIRLVLAIFRILVCIVAVIVRRLAHFPNAIVCTVVGIVVTVFLASLPGILSLLWYLGAAGTLVLAIRGAWTDLTVTSAENRIAARTVETISKATNQDHQP